MYYVGLYFRFITSSYMNNPGSSSPMTQKYGWLLNRKSMKKISKLSHGEIESIMKISFFCLLGKKVNGLTWSPGWWNLYERTAISHGNPLIFSIFDQFFASKPETKMEQVACAKSSWKYILIKPAFWPPAHYVVWNNSKFASMHYILNI